MTQLLATQDIETLVTTQSPVTDAEILQRLRQTHQILEITTATQQDKLIVNLCEMLKITVDDPELQAAGDTFRLSHHLTSATKTIKWFNQQQISVEDWTEGLRISLLKQKLKQELFGDRVDAHYLQNRDQFRRVALSQILVSDRAIAQQIFNQLKQEPQRFCEFALDYSEAKVSQQQGGFVGIRFLSELMPEVVAAIAEAEAGTLIEPIQTRLGFHILKVEKWFPTQLNEAVREMILEALFNSWLQQIMNSAGSRLD